jgi:hypothetical protein
MRGINMRLINIFTVSVAASLILSAVADASDAPGRGEDSTGKSEFFKAPSLPWDFQSLQRISPVRAEHYPAPDWSSAIGTGRAATAELRVEGLRPVLPISAQRPPSLIGALRLGLARRRLSSAAAVRIDPNHVDAQGNTPLRVVLKQGNADSANALRRVDATY